MVDETELDRLAAAPLDHTDAALLSRLRRLFEAADPVPDRLVDQVEFGLTLAAIFDDVDRLQRVETSAAGVRGTEQISTVTFSGPDVSVMLTLNPVAGGVRIDGWVAPGSGWQVGLSCPGAPDSRSTSTDEHGRFAFDRVPAELVQFTLHRGRAAEKVFTTPPLQL